MPTTFLPSQNQLIKNYYEEYGYVVVKNVISEDKITAFKDSYNILKASKKYYFLSQDTNRVEKLETNPQGFIEHSILNPIDLVFQNTFSHAALDIVTLPLVSELLTNLSNCQKHTIWQTMFFDKSTGTVAHQDHYYLDSDPPGNLIACWFALEDIHPDAGTFFVIPKSHKGKLIAANSTNHEDYVHKIQSLIQDQDYTPQPMPLEKGSVLFWHPFLIHGAFENANPNYSRKSLTAHYLPSSYGRFGKSLPLQVTSPNPDILLWKKTVIEHLKASVRHLRFWAMYNLRDKQQRSKMEMRSSQY